ncbi:hypothetical protein AALB39_04445 [Lachnospiraceae bacterium 54-53]
MNNVSDYSDERQRELYRKFPSTHFLSRPENVHHVLLWNTLFKRNLHKVAIDYLGIKLHFYQTIILYFMGISQIIAIIASRAAAKSFIIALYACCRAITRPYSKIVLGSATRGQSKLIISEKIVNELMEMSPALRREIRSIKDSQNESIVFFKNGSTIRVFTANKFARGLRSHVAVREEAMQIDQDVDNSVISPFQTIRQAPYMLEQMYSSIEDLKEDPVDVYISSSWFEPHWVWDKIVDPSFSGMLKDKNMCVLAFDESITLKHNIRTQKQMQLEKLKQDPTTFAIEFLNLRMKQNASAFFPYKILLDNQNLKRVFYPRRNEDFRAGIKNKFSIPKQPGEIRVVSCDFAFIDRDGNDNSAYCCVRALPEAVTYDNGGVELEVKNGYRREYSYIEAPKGGDTTLQAIRIRQLFEDYDADYFILDARNAGSQIVMNLGKVMFDAERQKEYSPLKVMNDDVYANMVKSPEAKECIFVINASQQLNSDMANSFKINLVQHKINLLVNLNTAQDEILSQIKEYTNECDLDRQFEFEKPFLESQALITEASELMYEVNPQTKTIKVYEKSSSTKDRYVSAAMASYFIDGLEVDMLNSSSDYEYATLIN